MDINKLNKELKVQECDATMLAIDLELATKKSNDYKCFYWMNSFDSFPLRPRRIVSLVPSQTELLYALGLKEEVVGITKFCVHPEEWFRTKNRVGGTKSVNIEAIKALQPDLIIANKEENVREQIETIKAFAPVYVTDVTTFDEALAMITSVGGLVNKQREAVQLVQKIEIAFESITPVGSTVNTAYLIWKDPYMTVGGDTFISDLLTKCGFTNVFQNEKRYPEVEIQQLADSKCKLLLLSSEPYPFKQKHVEEIQQQLPGTQILLVDGEIFSWYGSRLVIAADYLAKLIEMVSS